MESKRKISERERESTSSFSFDAARSGEERRYVSSSTVNEVLTNESLPISVSLQILASQRE